MITTILFDVGGTLHTNKTTRESKLRLAGNLKNYLADNMIEIPDTVEDFCDKLDVGAKSYKQRGETTLIELPGTQIWRDYYLAGYHLTAAQLDPISEHLSFLFDSQHSEIIPRSGLKETLQQLKEMGYRLGIISNIISKTFIPDALDKYRISEYFEYILMSSQCGIRKPDRRIFDLAFQDMGITASECAYIGDTISRDVIGCKNAGVGLMIKIDNPLIRHKDLAFQGIDPDVLIRDLTEIPQIIAEYNNLKRRGAK